MCSFSFVNTDDEPRSLKTGLSTVCQKRRPWMDMQISIMQNMRFVTFHLVKTINNDRAMSSTTVIKCIDGLSAIGAQQRIGSLQPYAISGLDIELYEQIGQSLINGTHRRRD